MKNVLFILYLLSIGHMASYGQIYLTQDPKLERQLQESGLIHQPLPLNIEHSFEAYGWKKEVLQSTPLTHTTGTEGWSHSGAGSMSFSTEKTVSGKGSIKLQFPTFTGKRATGSPSDPDYATYGNSSVTYHLNGANLERYNRITFSIYPDCDGARIVNMNLTFHNADTPAKKGYNPPSGSHLINLVNKEWNHCFLEIDEYQRDKVMSISFSTALKGKDRTMGDSATYYIDNLYLQTVKAPEKVSGWIPADGKISYSTTGYAIDHPKTALINTNATKDAGRRFQLLTSDGKVAYEGDIREETTTLGRFGLIDFTSFDHPGAYRLKAGHLLTPTFRIGERLWEYSQWRVLNFIFCQRCGYPVPGKHASCHADLMSQHDGRSISYSGGWHDAGDLSQQTLQTGDVAFALLEAYNKQRNINPSLAAQCIRYTLDCQRTEPLKDKDGTRGFFYRDKSRKSIVHYIPQLNTFSSGEMTGEMPVGIRTLGNDDVPYWPQTNNACYKEVWVTSAGKWLSLIAEY